MITWADLGINTKGAVKGQVKTLCPECSSSRKHKSDPCLSVNLDEGVAQCWNCHKTYSLKTGAAYTRQYAVPSQSVDLNLPPSLLGVVVNRKITKQVLTRNCVGVSRKFFPQTQSEEECIAFPYFEGGTIVNYKYRALPKHHTMEKECKLTLYGINDIAGADYAIWVEGEFDKLAVEVAGFRNCVSVPNGASTGSMEYLKNCELQIRSVGRHILAVDNDEPGRLLKDELAKRLDPKICYYVRYPEGCKDANDVLIHHGPDRLKEMLLHPRPFPIEGIIKPESVSDEVLRISEHGTEPGLMTGWPDVDRHYTVKKGQWTVVTGIPSHGKSTWLDALMIRMAGLHKWKIGYYSPENFPVEQHVIYLLKKYIKKGFGREFRDSMSTEEVRRGLEWVNKHFTFFCSDDITFGLERILELASVSILRDGMDGLVIDPWNELDHQRPSKLSETEYISQSLTRLRQFARKHEVHIWLVAHPQKPVKEKASQKFPVPTMYDVSGSAHWYNKADNGVVVYNDIDEDDDIVQIHVQKVRFRDTGRPGMARLRYNAITGDYSNAE
jgi:twinkle protein